MRSSNFSAVQLLGWLVRALIFAMVMVLLLIGGELLRRQWASARDGSVTANLRAPNDSLNPLQAVYLQNYLSRRTDLLEEPVGSGAVQPFTIELGETATQVSGKLVQERLLAAEKQELFLNYLRYTGIEAEIEAGNYSLDPSVTLPELAQQLTQANANEIELTFLEGWRLEEMANYLDVVAPAQIQVDEFWALAQKQQPSVAFAYDMLAFAPSLEGFLFPDTYRIPTDADATYLVDLMVQTANERLSSGLRQAYEAQGLTVYEAVTVASLVEREAVLPEEQPIVASVFLNRIAQGIKLDADPTIQYALGYQADNDSWWKSPLDAVDLQIDSPYNTYLYSTLPPTPIANPGFGALQAVAQPAATDFVYFVVNCELNDGSHLFSVTFDEHLANVEKCQ